VSEAPIALVLSDHEGTQGFLQPLAGLSLWTAREIAAGATPAPRPEVRLQPPAADWRLVYDGPGLVEGRLQRISSWIEPTGFRRVPASGRRAPSSARSAARWRSRWRYAASTSCTPARW